MMPLRQALPRLVARIDAVTLRAGETARWLTLAIPVVCVSYALVRKLFRWGHNGFSELQWYLFACVYLVAAGYTLLRQGHVRVDVLWRRFPQRTRWIIDLVGLSLLAPICGYLAWAYWTFWTVSLRQREGPEDVLVGLERWPVKLALFAGFTLLALQCLAEALRLVGALRGWPAAAPPATAGDAPLGRCDPGSAP
ncbi:TRAP transporter small permease subunit [Aquabacterium humicola]|uniref:TRAP transporter small permease subunit n=1 Tax=Aquabacterium humicola TaxID=3237377 RepID=UPI002542715C|nr:TRAP transporter small permease subunit [Rubrivivax pictus]